MTATGPYVDRLIRIFRDRPNDDTSAQVLIDFANASIAAIRCRPLSRDVMLRIVHDYEEMGSAAMVEYLRDKTRLAVGHRDAAGLIKRLIEHAAAYESSTADVLYEAADAIAELIAAVKCAVDLTPAEGRKDWQCHWNITTPDKCARCGPELRVIAALSNIEGASHG